MPRRKKQKVTWAHLASTKTLERQVPAIKERAETGQELVDQVIGTISILKEDHPEIMGMLVIAERIRDQTRARVELVDRVLSTRKDRFDLDAIVDRIISKTDDTAMIQDKLDAEMDEATGSA